MSIIKIQKEKLPVPKKKNTDFFIPGEKDSVFWCWIIFLYGLGEYEILKQYKDGLLRKNEAVNHLIDLKKIDQRQAEKMLDNLESDKVVPMKIK